MGDGPLYVTLNFLRSVKYKFYKMTVTYQRERGYPCSLWFNLKTTFRIFNYYPYGFSYFYIWSLGIGKTLQPCKNISWTLMHQKFILNNILIYKCNFEVHNVLFYAMQNFAYWPASHIRVSSCFDNIWLIVL